MKQVWSVGRVASWAGFCLPCGRDDRPLVLTRSGASGLRAWLAGIGDDDRTLLLTCRVCGDWQVVPLREEDDPQRVVEPRPALEALVEDVRVDPRVPVAATIAPARPISTAARLVALPSIAVPAPRVPPEAVAAARSVLSAARTGASAGGTRTSAARTAAGKPRSSRRRGPTPRRPDTAPTRRVRTAAPARAGATSTVLPGDVVLDLLASGHQVVLSPAR